MLGNVGQGCRIVDAYGEDAVIKYGCPSDFMTGGQNLVEAAAWERVKGTPHATYFVPVLSYAADGSWLIMQRVKPLEPNEYQRAKAFRDMLVLAGFKDAHLDDLDTDNLGEMDGHTVALDYGFDMAARYALNLSGVPCKECETCRRQQRSVS